MNTPKEVIPSRLTLPLSWKVKGRTSDQSFIAWDGVASALICMLLASGTIKCKNELE
jgi:hypothetical protein